MDTWLRPGLLKLFTVTLILRVIEGASFSGVFDTRRVFGAALVLQTEGDLGLLGRGIPDGRLDDTTHNPQVALV
jgi:hypothetical protein